MVGAGNKRSRDEAEPAAPADDIKKQKQEEHAAEQKEEADKIAEQDEEQQPDEVEEVDAGDAADGAGMDGAEDETGRVQGEDDHEDVNEDEKNTKQAQDEPRKIGYKTFLNGIEAYKYYKQLLRDLRRNQDLNEYEKHMVLDLIKQGHHNADEKIGNCLRAIQVRIHKEQTSICFHLMHSNGTLDDVSVNKCLATLFPKWGKTRAAKKEAGEAAAARGGRGRGWGRGRGRGRGRRGMRGHGRRGRG